VALERLPPGEGYAMTSICEKIRWVEPVLSKVFMFMFIATTH